MSFILIEIFRMRMGRDRLFHVAIQNMPIPVIASPK